MLDGAMLPRVTGEDDTAIVFSHETQQPLHLFSANLTGLIHMMTAPRACPAS